MSEIPTVLDLTTELLVQIRNGVHDLGDKLDATNARVAALDKKLDTGLRAARVDREKLRTDLLATIAATESRLGARIEGNGARIAGNETRIDRVEARLARRQAQQGATTERLSQLVAHFATLVERDAERGVVLEAIHHKVDRLVEEDRLVPDEPTD